MGYHKQKYWTASFRLRCRFWGGANEPMKTMIRNIVPWDIDERNDIISSWDDEDNDLNDLFENVDNEFYAQEEDLELKLEPIIRRVMSE